MFALLSKERPKDATVNSCQNADANAALSLETVPTPLIFMWGKAFVNVVSISA